MVGGPLGLVEKKRFLIPIQECQIHDVNQILESLFFCYLTNLYRNVVVRIQYRIFNQIVKHLWVFILSGLEHESFRVVYKDLVPENALTLDQIIDKIS